VALSDYRGRIRTVARSLLGLVKGVVVAMVLTTVVALVGLTVIMMGAAHHLPDWWNDSLGALIAIDIAVGVATIVAIAVVVMVIDAVRVCGGPALGGHVAVPRSRRRDIHSHRG
jgi:hypothetical protein